MLNLQKLTKYTTNIFIFEICTMDRICIESEFEYVHSKQICKCLKFRDLNNRNKINCIKTSNNYSIKMLFIKYYENILY
jgi:hypothetical protein